MASLCCALAKGSLHPTAGAASSRQAAMKLQRLAPVTSQQHSRKSISADCCVCRCSVVPGGTAHKHVKSSSVPAPTDMAEATEHVFGPRLGHKLPDESIQPILVQGTSWCDGLAHEVLRRVFPEHIPSVSRAKRYCRKHRIFVDGRRVNTTAYVEVGQHLTVLGRKEHPPNPLLESVEVLHDDEHIAVLVKPEGVFTHGHGRGRSRKSMTHIVSRLLAPTQERDALAKPSPGHRLDKGTGGIVVFVKTVRAAQGMQDSFERQKSVQKRYRAMVTAKVQEDTGIIDSPVDDKESVTRFTVVERMFQPHLDAWTTVVDLVPETGRRHQLRIHLASIGHPIVGEHRYHQEATVPEDRIFEGWLGKGLFLWALELRFAHPVDGTEMRFSIDEPEKFGKPVGRVRRRRQGQAGKDASLAVDQPGGGVA
eukprot:jgi/Ulvmu1/9603/UM054_0033.1